jgi:2-keto-4-pentenoate hydratase
MPNTHSTSIAELLKAHHAAHFLNLSTRQGIAIQALAGHTPISHIAEQYSVSQACVEHHQRGQSRRARTQHW